MAVRGRGEQARGRGRTRRGKTAVDLMRAVAGEQIVFGVGDPPRLMSQREALARVLWAMALRGDLTACRLLLEYMEGKPLQTVAAALGRLQPPELTADELAQAEAALAAWRSARLPEPAGRHTHEPAAQSRNGGGGAQSHDIRSGGESDAPSNE